MAKKDCPNCGVVNPLASPRCLCGYDFKSKTVGAIPTRSAPKPWFSFSLRRVIFLSAGLLLIGYGTWSAIERPEDVLGLLTIDPLTVGCMMIPVGILTVLASILGVNFRTGRHIDDDDPR
jgi:hypothetical protein